MHNKIWYTFENKVSTFICKYLFKYHNIRDHPYLSIRLCYLYYIYGIVLKEHYCRKGVIISHFIILRSQRQEIYTKKSSVILNSVQRSVSFSLRYNRWVTAVLFLSHYIFYLRGTLENRKRKGNFLLIILPGLCNAGWFPPCCINLYLYMLKIMWSRTSLYCCNFL